MVYCKFVFFGKVSNSIFRHECWQVDILFNMTEANYEANIERTATCNKEILTEIKDKVRSNETNNKGNQDKQNETNQHK